MKHSAVEGLRVDIVVNALGVGGAERHSVALARGLAAHGCAMRVIALPAAGDEQVEAFVATVPNALQLRRNNRIDLPALREYRRLLRADPPTLCITVNQYPLAFAYAASFAAMRRTPLLQINHSMGHPYWRRLYPYLLRKPAAVVYVSELQRQHWRQLGVRSRPDHCVHNGVDLSRFRPQPSEVSAATRASLGLHGDDFVVGLCAVMRQEKRHDLLLQALVLLRQRGHMVHALLIGDGAERERIEMQVRTLQLEGQVHITGYRQDVVPLLAACDIACLVSDYEAFPLSILEAMALGKPVVATRVGAAQEQIDDGESGLLVPPGDVKALADAIERLRDGSVRTSFGHRALTAVRSRFDAAIMYERYARIIAGVARPSALPPARLRGSQQ